MDRQREVGSKIWIGREVGRQVGRDGQVEVGWQEEMDRQRYVGKKSYRCTGREVGNKRWIDIEVGRQLEMWMYR